MLPSFLIILAIAMFISNFQDNPWVVKIFKGIRPVVVSLIAVPMINMARKGNKTWWAWLISAAALVGVAVLGISPIYILLTVIVGALAICRLVEQRHKQKLEGR